MTRRRPPLRHLVAPAVLAASAAAMYAGCGGDSQGGTGTTAPSTMITKVVVSPRNAALAVGASVRLAGTAYTAAGTQATVPNFTWQHSNARAATLADSGLAATVTGVAAGVDTVTMTFGANVDTSIVTVAGH